jgi:hypothetical protein
MTAVRVVEPADANLHGLASLVKRLALLPRCLSLARVEFAAPGEGTAIVYLGEGEALDFVRAVLARDLREVRATRVFLWRLGEAIERCSAPGIMLCLELNRLLGGLVPPGGRLAFPWIRQVVYLKSPQHQERRRAIEANFGRKVRKYGYRCHEATDARAVERFYRDLYVPHLTARHGAAVRLRSLDELRKWAATGFVLQVLQGETWIAGGICSVRNERLAVPAFGHLPEAAWPLRRGALSAVYYFLFDCARRRGLDVVDLLRSRPHAQDGVYRHKRLWGACAERDRWVHSALWLYPPRDSPIPASCEPLLVWEGNGFAQLGEVLRGSARAGHRQVSSSGGSDGLVDVARW